MSITREPFEIRYSPGRLIVLAAQGAGMTAASVFVALKLAKSDSFAQFACFIGVPLFGLATLVAVWRLIADRNKVIIRITENGFTDLRIAPQEILWAAVLDIGTITIKRQRMLVLDLNPSFEATLSFSRMVRWSRSANAAALGIRGLTTNAQGLDIDFEQLRRLYEEHVAGHSYGH